MRFLKMAPDKICNIIISLAEENLRGLEMGPVMSCF